MNDPRDGVLTGRAGLIITSLKVFGVGISHAVGMIAIGAFRFAPFRAVVFQGTGSLLPDPSSIMIHTPPDSQRRGWLFH